MIVPNIAGGVFDVDDVITDNKQRSPEGSLHDRSQLLAVHEAGELFDYEELTRVTVKQVRDWFLKAPQHTAESGIRLMLEDLGLGPDKNEKNKFESIVKTIVTSKDLKHLTLLREVGEAHEGVVDFARGLIAAYAIELATATMAARAEVEIILGMVGLNESIPDPRRVTREQIKRPKPHMEAFNKGFLTLGLPNSARRNTIAIEDDPKGIASAKAAGLYVVGYTSRHDREYLSSQDVRPDVIVDSFAEAAELFGL